MSFMSFILSTLSSIFLLLLGMIVGAGAVIFRIVTKEIDRRKTERLPEFYVNLVVTNKNKIIDKQVEESHKKQKEKRKFHINLDPMNFGVDITEQAAHRIVGDDKFMLRLATEVAKGIKYKFSPQKIDAVGEVSFVKGCYAVIKVTILKIDAPFLVGKQLDEEKMNKLRKVVHWLGYAMGEENVKFGIRSQLTKIVVDQSVKTLGQGMENLLKNEQGVESDVVVKLNEDQPHFFYELVKPLEGQKDDKISSEKLHSFDDSGKASGSASADSKKTA